MKYRRDFVTNSSSSSFIVAFADEEELKKCKEDMEASWQKYADRVFSDIEESRISSEEAEAIVREALEWEAWYTLLYRENRDKPKSWAESKEFKAAQKSRVEKGMKAFRRSIKDCKIFAEVEYSDHMYPELEHDIMPNCPFTKKVLNHH